MNVRELISELSKLDQNAEILVHAPDYKAELYIESIITRGEVERSEYTDEEYERWCKTEKLMTHPHPSDIFLTALIWV